MKDNIGGIDVIRICDSNDNRFSTGIVEAIETIEKIETIEIDETIMNEHSSLVALELIAGMMECIIGVRVHGIGLDRSERCSGIVYVY